MLGDSTRGVSSVTTGKDGSSFEGLGGGKAPLKSHTIALGTEVVAALIRCLGGGG